MSSGGPQSSAEEATPLDPVIAVAALDAAADLPQIFGLLLRAARASAAYAALVSVHASELRGQRALGDESFDLAAIKRLRLARGMVPAFEQVIETGFAHLGPIATGNPSIDAQLQSLGGQVPASVMVLPVIVNQGTKVLLIGHRGRSEMRQDDVSNLLPMLTATGRALERLTASHDRVTSPKAEVSQPACDQGSTLRQQIDEHREAQSWSELSGAIRTLLRQGNDSGDLAEDEHVEMLFELGTIEAKHLDQPERAIEAWRSALALDSGDSRVQDALEQLYSRHARWKELIELLERRAALTDDVSERVGVLLHIAACYQDQLDEPAQAIHIYRQILSLLPEHDLASVKLEDLYRSRGQWPELAALLVDRAAYQDEPGRAVASLEVAAEIYEDHVGDTSAAFLVWLAIIRREPEREGLIHILERLYPAASTDDDLLGECEELAEELQGDHRPMAARLWRRIGRWRLDRRKDPEAAAEAFDRALLLDSSDLDAVLELVALRRSIGPPEELARLLGRCVDIEVDGPARAILLVELATVLDSELEQRTEAQLVLERALDQDPSCGSAAAALRRMYRDAGDWNALAAMLSRHAKAITGHAEAAFLAEVYRELGDVLAGYLARPDEAARAFETAVEIDPANSGAYGGLKQLRLAGGNRDAYLELEEAELAAAEAPDAARYASLAQQWQERGAFERAARAWRKVLIIDPDHPQAYATLLDDLRKLGRWDEVAAVCRERLAALPSGPGRAPVLLDLASALESGPDDVEGAIRACEESLTFDADHKPARDMLSRLYERHGRLHEALVSLERLWSGGLASDRERADVQERMGHLHVQRGDPEAATACFDKALAVDARRPGAHEGLGTIHRNLERWSQATHHFVRAADLSSGLNAIRCLMNAADIYWQRMGDTARAHECLERAIAEDPSRDRVRQVLCGVLFQAGEWEALWPHIARLTERVTNDPDAAAEDRRDLLLRAARCAAEIGQTKTALELLDRTLVSSPDDVTVLLARAYALYRGGSWDQAANAYTAILDDHGDSLDRRATGGAYRQLARIHKKLGRSDEAARFYDKAIELSPRNRQILEERVDLEVGRKRFGDAIATLRRLAELSPTAERAEILERIGDLYASEVGDSARAAATYREASSTDPANHQVLQKLLDVQSEAGMWPDALETIGQFAELEAEPTRRCKYFMARAAIRLEKLSDPSGAIDEYERALETLISNDTVQSSSRTRAIEILEAVHDLADGAEHWTRLARAYRMVIKGLPQREPILIQLWQSLGEIYRAHLHDYESAVVALEAAHALDPAKQPDRVRLISELFSLAGDATNGYMVERAEMLVATDPSNPDALRALARAYSQAGCSDQAWCVCRALVFRKQARATEEELYRQHREQNSPSGVLDDDAWQFLRHSDEDLVISSIFAIIWEGPVALRSGPTKSFDLKARDKLRVEDGADAVSEMIRNAARVLNVPLPQVYVLRDRPGKVLLANCLDNRRLSPSLILGRDLIGFSGAEVAFSLASMLALLRPNYYLRLTLPTVDELEAGLAAAAIAVGRPLSVRPEPAAAAGAFVSEIRKRLTATATESLAQLIAQLPDKPNLRRWRDAADAAGRRAGLLLCGDLDAAARVVSSEPLLPGGPRAADKVRDLLRYSISTDYFAARRHLGVALA